MIIWFYQLILYKILTGNHCSENQLQSMAQQGNIGQDELEGNQGQETAAA